MTAKQLYDNSIRYIQKVYVNPQKASAGNIENKYFSVNTYNKTISTVSSKNEDW